MRPPTRARGALKQLADATRAGATFVVPDDVGGRFSVLSAVGLLPDRGCRHRASTDLMKGAAEARGALHQRS